MFLCCFFIFFLKFWLLPVNHHHPIATTTTSNSGHYWDLDLLYILAVQYIEENERVAVAMDKACTDPAVGRAMERLWRKRFT